ncbi:hypothetical protein RHGRI_019445 [Rhododendron griersonianum]|uniref:DUF4220 domain-containing protein n=1 Tax=Rhododendron griersonianum TaxID=479676 RepID=A0AAV6JGY6_9ERIC|nr:hypothetical protein RHGRI_019445 [Rhododendron griersonianum]
MPCYRTCSEFIKSNEPKQKGKELSKNWEIWDLRILALYILVSQLCLHFFGRRTKTKSAVIMIKIVWLLYLLSDLLATIALGKLSKLAVNKNSKATDSSSNTTTANTRKIPMGNFTIGNATMGNQMLRVMWGPLILFYLGGPDTITVLNLQENQLWMRHLIGLFTQGFRAVYALIATWSYFPQKKLLKAKPWSIEGLISLLAVLILIPGLIKYGERVWIIQSRNKYDGGYVRLNPSQVRVSDSRPNAKRVLLAYFCIQTLMPHCPDYMCDGRRVRDLVRNFLKSVRKDSFDAFKLIEIEMGLIYDMLFSKVGTIFTLWGSILRFLSLSLIVSGFLVFLKSDKPPPSPGRVFEGDDVITIILIAGAIFLEIAGIVVQLFSDWALVWACSDRIKWATPLLSLHEVLFSKSQRWPGVIGQLSLLDFYTKYDPNACTRCLKGCFVKCLGNTAWEYLFGMGEALKGYKNEKSLVPDVKKLIISYLRKKYDPSQTSTQKIAEVDNSKTSTEETGGSEIVEPTSHEKVADDGIWSTSGVTRGEWTLQKYDERLKWSIELQFDKSIVIWHVATDVLYGLDHGSDTVNRKAVKMLSDYMMYLLVECPTKFPFCNKYDTFGKDYDHLKELFIRELPSRQKRVENEGDTSNIANEADKLVEHMKSHEPPKRWAILASIWAEMLCYAAWRCRVKYHIGELRHGGEFLTRVWLLQMHCDRTLRRSSSSMWSDLDDLARKTSEKGSDCSCFGSTTT